MTVVDLGTPEVSTEQEAPVYRSVSQYNQFERCPYQYYLSRIKKVWQRPAAWLPQGSAVHAAIEAWEKSLRTLTLEEVQEIFKAEYAKEVSEYTEHTPNFNWWFASGPYKAIDDLPRRFKIGLEQVEKYFRWAEDHPEERVWWTPGGVCSEEAFHDPDCEDCQPKPAVELSMNIDLDGVPVLGFIDLVYEVDGEIRVRDHKTGNSPGDDFQLGVYGVALHLTYGVDPPQLGDYWMGRTGKPTVPYKISDWTVERVTEEFHKLDESIRKGVFEPRPEPDKCKFCDVNTSCEFRAS